ncbi:MAG: response regulator [Mariprofundaceae bacterium]|nr:response regulator [Mariprofundaceae bacterium]
MSDKILIVDDETFIREEVVECLCDYGYDCVETGNALQALEILRQDQMITMALVDIRMPGMSGLDMIAMARSDGKVNPELEYIVVTGHGETSEAIEALKKGTVDFLQKPVDSLRLIHAVDRAQELVSQKRAKYFYEKKLCQDSYAKSVAFNKLCTLIDHAYDHVMHCLANGEAYQDSGKDNAVDRIGEYAAFVAAKLGWSQERQNKILLAAPLHDIGKIATPKNILAKPSALIGSEWSIVQQHPAIGYRILSRSQQPVMQMAAHIALEHHETWIGSGYPIGLKGDAISMEALITSLVVVYDTLRSERPYKPALDHEEAVARILNGDGRTHPSHFSPDLLILFKKHSASFNAIFLA